MSQTQKAAESVARDGLEYLVNFKRSDHLSVLLNLDYNIIGLFTGNQAGKTSNIAVAYFYRLMGLHPVKRKNQILKRRRGLL